VAGAIRPTRLFAKKRTRKARAKRTPEYRREATAAFKRAREQVFGSQGAASPVRKIDPKTGEVIRDNPARLIVFVGLCLISTSSLLQQPCCLFSHHAVNAVADM
jgi:hypothetical protein